MPYRVVFPSERVERVFQRTLEKLPSHYQDTVIAAVRSLSTDPRPSGKRTKKLAGELIVGRILAEYRLRIGPYRVLYDIDDHNKTVVILKLSKRHDHTYK